LDAGLLVDEFKYYLTATGDDINNLSRQ